MNFVNFEPVSFLGKSTVAVHLANALVAKGKRVKEKKKQSFFIFFIFFFIFFFFFLFWKKVGLLDVDLTGPSVPRLVGLSTQAVHKASTG
jgi:Mrp family chromosome partitioning ATPase